jgi:peroxiredoxin
LCQHKEELESLHTDVLLVSFGAPTVAEVWLKENCPDFRLLLDPERAVYRAYGVEHSLVRSWNPRTLRRYAQLMRQGWHWRGIKGDSAQLGGDFVIGKDGRLLLAHPSHDPTDRPSAESLLEVLRSAGTGD